MRENVAPDYNAIHASYMKKGDFEESLHGRFTDVEGKRMELMKYVDVMEGEIKRSKEETEAERERREIAEKAKIEREKMVRLLKADKLTKATKRIGV